MKKIIVLVFLFLGSFNVCFAQSGWFTQQGTLPVIPFDIFFIDSQTGWISADTGKILKTINGGTNWSLYSTGATCNLYVIKFINTLTGWAAGSIPFQNPFSYEHAVIVKTTNGGINWITQYYNNNGYKFNSLAIASENNVFATSYGTDESGYSTIGFLFMTSNSGVNWFSSTMSGPGFTNVFFLNSQVGWSCAFTQMDVPPTMRMIYKTTNTGINWTRIYKDTLFSFFPLFYKIQMFDTNIGYLRTNLLKKTFNGGLNWGNTDSASTYGISDFYFISKDTGWVCKNPIKYTTNAGTNWTSQSIPYSVNKLFFINNKIGWAIGNYPIVLLKTINGGNLFTISGLVRYSDNNQLVTSGWVKAIKLDKNTANIIVLDSAIIQSNGSYTLPNVPQDSLDIGVYPNSTPPNDYVITYYPSTIYWRDAITLYPTGNLTNINIGAIRMSPTTNSNSVNGKVMRLTENPLGNLKDAVLYAKNGNTFVRCSVSDGNGIYHLNSLPIGNLKIIVNRLGFRSDSISVNVTATSNIDSINFYLNCVYVGIKQIENTVPSEYKLYQNYPNPFNPSTIIRFTIPSNAKGETSNTQLVVYDILGREIITLVNEKLQAGTYEIPFSINQFSNNQIPSGIYFYKLETESYKETKRMVLIK